MRGLVERAIVMRAGEGAAAGWSFAYFFCVLSSYYILRPVRETLGAAAGVEGLPWLFTGTFLAMLAAVPVFGGLAARFPRRTLLPVVYGFFIACILALFVLLRSGETGAWAPAAFFIWLSVFNLFVVSVFWSFMADVWREEQARRLFGVIAAGGSAGAMAGPAITAVLAARVGPVNLLPLSALILAGALVCIVRLRRWAVAPEHGPAARAAQEEAPLGGSPFAGLTGVLRSAYLLGICGFVALGNLLGTFIYFQQALVIRAAYAEPGERTAVFAMMDLAVNALTIFAQLFVTGRLAGWIGLPRLLAALPALSLLGFGALAAMPSAPVLIAYQVLRRATTYGVTGPALQVLFTVLSREEKYKAKNVIDTLVYRGADALSGWAYAGLTALGMGISGIALLALPVSAVWSALAVHLGRREEELRHGG
ncbi:MAG TPA: MFS transporter [Methylomirabilota bacterium]|nr:MFS transporter [Methylomirabilota bacterium]